MLQLQEIAYEYKNCDKWKLTFDMKNKRISRFVVFTFFGKSEQIFFLGNVFEYNTLKKTCTGEVKPVKLKKITSVVATASFFNSSTNKITKFENNIKTGCEIITKKSDLLHSCECLDGSIEVQKSYGTFESYTTSMWRPGIKQKY